MASTHADPLYNLVSILYHELHEAETCEEYIRAAREGGDRDLLAFFEECQQRSRDIAERAKSLVQERLGASYDLAQEKAHNDELVEEKSMESFPASDPPAY